MVLDNYEKLDMDAVPEGNCPNPKPVYHVTIRSKRRVYLCNREMLLVRILDLKDYGIQDKRKTITCGDREIEVSDEMRKSLAIDLQGKRICVWSEKFGLSLYNLNEEMITHLPGRYSCAAFDSRTYTLWTVLRNNDQKFTLSARDYDGKALASLTMEDPLHQSMFGIESLPEQDGICLSLGAGQDGSQDYFLHRDGTEISVSQTLPDDLSYLFPLQEDSALLLDFYDETLFRMTYPVLEETATFPFPQDEDFSPGQILRVDERTALLCNSFDQRYYLFDTDTMTLVEELEIVGYESAPSKALDGDVVTDIQSMDIQGDKLFIHYSKGFHDKQREWVLVTDLAELARKD